MTISFKKSFFRVLLNASGLPAIALALLTIEVYKRHGPFAERLLIPIWLSFNALLAALAMYQLRRLYMREPANWSGRWQLSLGDLISIACFFGLMMLLMRLWADEYSEDFLMSGLPVAFAVGTLYGGATLVLSRIGTYKGLQKWLNAVGVLFVMSLTAIASFTLQWLLLWVVLHQFR